MRIAVDGAVDARLPDQLDRINQLRVRSPIQVPLDRAAHPTAQVQRVTDEAKSAFVMDRAVPAVEP